MLASINPLGERGRNQHYPVTVAAFIASATFAGASLGAVLGLVGARFAASTTGVGVVIALLALTGLLLDSGRARLARPGSTAPGRGDLAHDVPGVGLRRRVRRAARARVHHDRHRIRHLGRVRVRAVVGVGRGRAAHRCRLRPGTGAARAHDGAHARAACAARAHAPRRRVGAAPDLGDVRGPVLRRARGRCRRDRSARVKLAAHRVALGAATGMGRPHPAARSRARWRADVRGRPSRDLPAPRAARRLRRRCHRADAFPRRVGRAVRIRARVAGTRRCSRRRASRGCAPTCSAARGCSDRCRASSGASCSSPRGSARSACTSWPGVAPYLPRIVAEVNLVLESMEILL